MPLEKIGITKFLELADNIPVIDVRSPSEYMAGHIPSSINIPLFDDIERAAVGTRYKNEGRVPAILEGLKLTASSMSLKLEQALKSAKTGKLLVHCWRGGIRSESMAWLFSLGDIKTEVLDGGYKSYRNYILENLSRKSKMIVLGGMTGSSKTYILKYLRESNHQVIDLEGLANHKGSAFGSLGQAPQPSTEQFANLLFNEWKRIDHNLPFWVEDESRNIGSVFMPEKFYLNMQDTPAIILMMDLKTRLPRLMQEYTSYPPEILISSISKISKRLGGNNTQDAIQAVEAGDFEKAIEITLNYYDKAYLFGLKKKKPENITWIKTDTDNIEINAIKVIEAANKIIW